VFNEERNAIQCIQLYELNDNKHSEGGILSINDYPTYFEALHGNRDIAVDDTYNNPITQEFCQHYLPRFNITSLLDAPIQFGNHFSGIVCHEHVGTKRRWTPDEKNFAGSIADLAALAFEVKKRQGAEAALRASNLELEAKVQARTAELAGLNADLKKEITERKRTEAILLESELRLRLAINASNIGVWDWNNLDNTINYSSEWKRQLGYDDNDISNHYTEWETRLHPDDKEKAVTTNVNFINGNFPNTAMEFRLRHKNGSYRWIHSRGQIVDRDENGKATRILGCHIDITKLKESEEALKVFRWFAESAGQGLAMALFDGAINYLNPALIKTLDSLGFSLEQRNQLSSFYADESAKILNNEILPKLFSDGQWIGELELGSDKNNRIPTFNNFFAVCNELGKPQYIANIITDISQQKEVELQLRNAKLAAESADRTKSLFIASMSHELRTPLNAIIGFTGILLQGLSGELNERQQDQLNRVSRSAKHLLGLITDIIDLSKIEANRIDAYPETMDLQEVIAQATDSIRSHANEKGLSLDINVPFGITVHTDRKRLLQCVINLLSNAVKYTEKGTVHLTVSSTNTEVLITVKDTGIGIDDKDLERLFIPFERLDSILRINTPGTGLGLYLTQKIAMDLLGGKVSVQSESGVGSCFTLSIRKQLEAKWQKNETTVCE
ncbi:partial two-component system, NarL family, sensor histidine kinase EvgS, partial [biofilm metagenome]